MTLQLFLFLFIGAVAAGLKHDDLIIAVGDQIEFLLDGTRHQRLQLESYNASKLSALAYDSTTGQLFFSDRRHLRGRIFSVNIDSQHIVQDIVQKSSNETVESLTYDPVDRHLLWTDGLDRSIRRIKIDSNNQRPVIRDENSTVQLLHFLERDDKPRGLVSDPCTRMLYWTNRYMSRPTIERSRLDGSRRQIVTNSNLTLPHALDLDVPQQKLYWADNLRNGYFNIETSFVNGSAREIIYSGIGQFVVSLAVGQDYVYWSDYDHKQLWFLAKDGSSDKPVLLTQYIRNPATSLVVFRRKPVDCHLVAQPDDIKDDNLEFNNGHCPVRFSGDDCQLVANEESSSGWNDSCDFVAGRNNSSIVLIIILAVVCFILLTTVIVLSVRLWRLTGSKRPRNFKRRCLPPRSNNKLSSDDSSTIQDLENCCNSITMCERPAFCPQQVNSENDEANLLRYEF